jgi:predicted PurR-regulated permease PerM
LGDVLLPFVLGAAIAYFLDPVADKLERLGLSRVLAVLVISLAVVIVLLPAVIFCAVHSNGADCCPWKPKRAS